MPDISEQAIEYDNQKKAEEAARPKSNFTHDQLLDALMWCHDAFDRASMTFFLIYDTYKQVKNGDDLRGNSLTIGVRKPEWVSGGQRILEAYIGMPDSIVEGKDYDIAKYWKDGVPVDIFIFPDDLCFQQCDSIAYNYETFMLPNPYERFEQLYARN